MRMAKFQRRKVRICLPPKSRLLRRTMLCRRRVTIPPLVRATFHSPAVPWAPAGWPCTPARCLHPTAATVEGLSGLLVEVGRQTADALDEAAALHGQHLVELPLGAGGAAASGMALARLGPGHLARPGQAEPLRGGLMRLEL